jgi:hypothetical protein
MPTWPKKILFGKRFEYLVLQNDDHRKGYIKLHEVTTSQLEGLNRLEGYDGDGKSNVF